MVDYQVKPAQIPSKIDLDSDKIPNKTLGNEKHPNNQLNSKYNRFILLKGLIFIVVLTFLILKRDVSSNQPSTECIEDYVLNYLKYFNELVNQNESWRLFFEISSSAIMDFTFIVTFLNWVFRRTNARIFMTMFFFYGSRAVCQILFKLRYPQGYLWPFPGIYSLTVPYGQMSDFFFSGHSGFLLICSLELRTTGARKLSYLITVFIGYMVFVLLIFRIHYSFDITTGLFYAHYSFRLISKNLEALDRFWINLYIEFFCSATFVTTKIGAWVQKSSSGKIKTISTSVSATNVI